MAKDNGNFQIIFYILAAVIGLAVNAYRNYTKRKQREMQPENEEENFPEVLFGEDEDMPREESEVLFEEVESVPEPEPEAIKEEPTGPEKEELYQKEGTSEFNLTEEKLISDDIDPLATVENPDYISVMAQSIYLQEEEETLSEVDFDLETAVIFSEILKPKYFENGY